MCINVIHLMYKITHKTTDIWFSDNLDKLNILTGSTKCFPQNVADNISNKLKCNLLQNETLTNLLQLSNFLFSGVP